MRNGEIITHSEEATKVFRYINEDISTNLPFFTQFDHVNSAFVQIRCIIETSCVPDYLRLYLEIFLDLFFELSLLQDGTIIPYDKVVAALNRDLLNYSASLGFRGDKFECGSFSQEMIVDLKVEKVKYKEGIKWLHDLLFKTIFSEDKLKINVSKLLNEIPQKKRKGPVMTRASIYNLNFDSTKSNHGASNINQQQKFLTEISKKLEDKQETSKIISDLEQLRKYLVDPKNFRIQIVGNFTTIPDPKKVLKENLLSIDRVNELLPINLSQNFLSKHKGPEGNIIGIAAIESSFLSQSVKCITSFSDPDEAAMLVIIEYLTGMESPFWKRIRGLGLSYGYGITMKIEEGLLYFSLTKSSNVVKAYQEAKDIIEDILSGNFQFEDIKIESAKSGAIFGVVSREENIQNSALQSLLNHLKQLGPDANKILLTNIQRVTKSDLLRVLEKYLKPLFNPKEESLKTVIATNPSKLEEITQEFALMGRNFTVKNSK